MSDPKDKSCQRVFHSAYPQSVFDEVAAAAREKRVVYYDISSSYPESMLQPSNAAARPPLNEENLERLDQYPNPPPAFHIVFDKERCANVLTGVMLRLREVAGRECKQLVGDMLLGGSAFGEDRVRGRLHRIACLWNARTNLTNVIEEVQKSPYDAVGEYVERCNKILELSDPGDWLGERIIQLHPLVPPTQASSPTPVDAGYVVPQISAHISGPPVCADTFKNFYLYSDTDNTHPAAEKIEGTFDTTAFDKLAKSARFGKSDK
jgi:hypothetical protein